MARQVLETRVESLEQRVTALEQLPERMDRLESQILQFRAEVRSEFSAIRQEISAGDAETRRFSRVLHEDAIGRIAVVAEGVAALTEKLETLSLKFDRTDAKADLILARLDQPKRKSSRRAK